MIATVNVGNEKRYAQDNGTTTLTARLVEEK